MPLEERPLQSSLSLSDTGGHGKKLLSMNRDPGPHQTPDLPAPWSWTSSLPSGET